MQTRRPLTFSALPAHDDGGCQCRVGGNVGRVARPGDGALHSAPSTRAGREQMPD
ncbi:hypothetical protein C8Q77DRAFT_1145147 [Trametes polyzona]|nr:hypothetical protein C8Q77DRAFT_1145147 [Trametes polyzona]